jgi:hypothetical protein
MWAVHALPIMVILALFLSMVSSPPPGRRY